MTDKVLMAVLVLGLGVIINHIGIDEEDTMGSSVGSFDGTTHGKILTRSIHWGSKQIGRYVRS